MLAFKILLSNVSHLKRIEAFWGGGGGAFSFSIFSCYFRGSLLTVSDGITFNFGLVGLIDTVDDGLGSRISLLELVTGVVFLSKYTFKNSFVAIMDFCRALSIWVDCHFNWWKLLK